jgi:hypothetical protein
MKKKYNIPKEARHLPIPGNQLSSTYESADRSHYSPDSLHMQSNWSALERKIATIWCAVEL